MFLRKFVRPSMMMMMKKNMSGGVAAARESSTATTFGPAAEVVKSTKSPVQELIKIYQETIDEIQGVPEDEGYRKALEATTRQRLDICLEERDDPEAIQERIAEAIEERIGCGDLEELIRDAQFEYKILSNLLEWDPWGINQGYVSKVVDHVDQVKRTVPGIIQDELYERLKHLAMASFKEDEPKTQDIPEDSYSDEPPEGMFSSDNNSFSDEPDESSSSDNNP